MLHFGTSARPGEGGGQAGPLPSSLARARELSTLATSHHRLEGGRAVLLFLPTLIAVSLS